MKKNIIDIIALAIVIIGAINLGLFGLARIDLIYQLFGSVRGLVRGIDLIIGVAGLYSIFILAKQMK
jgi:uncharacterized membrane protein YuzA (DUF378 family)